MYVTIIYDYIIIIKIFTNIMFKKIIPFVVITTITLSSCNNEESYQKIQNKTETEIETNTEIIKAETEADIKTETWALTQGDNQFFELKSKLYRSNIDLSGTVEVEQETGISAKIGWRISRLYSKIWDIVKKWDLILELNKDEISVQLKTAINDVASAKEVLAAQKELLNEKVKSANNWLKMAELNLETAKKSLSDLKANNIEQIKLVKAQLSQAEIGFQNTQSLTNQRIKSLYAISNTIMRSAMTSVMSSFAFANQLLDPDDKISNSYNDRFGQYLWVLNTTSRTTALTSTRILSQSIKNVRAKWENSILTAWSWKILSKEETETAMREIMKTLEIAQRTMWDIYIMLWYSSDWSWLTQERLESWKNQILQYINNIEMAYDNGAWWWVFGWLVKKDEINTQNNIEISMAKTKLILAKQALLKAKAAINQSQTPAESWVRNATIAVDQAKVQIATVKAAKTTTIWQLERWLSASQWTLNLIRKQFWNTKIYAPFNWVITQKYAEEWEVVGPGQKIFLLSNTDVYKIKTNIPDNFLDMESLWNSIDELNKIVDISVKVDWVNKILKAKISRIDPSVNPLTHTLWSELVIIDAPSEIKVWQFATISVSTPERKGFFIPKYLLGVGFDDSYVKLESWEKKVVKILDEKEDKVQIYFEWIKDWIKIIHPES